MTTSEEQSRLLVERGMSIAAPYQSRDGVLGAFVFGSASRPYADERSDVDVQIVVEDGSPLPETTDRLDSRKTEGMARVSDVWIITPSELARLLSLRGDMNRRRVAKAHVLFDEDGTVARLVASAAAMPDAVRAEAMRVHHAEVALLVRSIASAETRAKAGALHLLAATTLVTAAANLLFYERHEWPVAPSWMFEELALVGVPADIIQDLRALCAAPSAEIARRLGSAIDAHLVSRGVRHAPSDEVTTRAARERFGGEATRLDFLGDDGNVE